MNISSNDAALLVVDVQYDFCPGGALAVDGGDEIVPVVNALLARYGRSVATQDWHPSGHQSFASSHPGAAELSVIETRYGKQVLWPDHCVQGTRGAELHAELELERFNAVIRKGFRSHVDSYSAFYENDKITVTGLRGFLHDHGVTTVYVCGLATDFCVSWTALDARAQGFDVVVIEDACRAIDVDGSLADAKWNMKTAGVEFAMSGMLL